ncbi:MAG: general secretion pathway protein GspK [Planctomycetes bacterium]|nr:general secretion pathway protein GspK [Planctomycetota bacterium]
MITSRHISYSPDRRGSVIVVVLWAIGISALIVSSVQLVGYRQKVIGTETLAKVQSRWAARGGIEYIIAVMADHTKNPVPDDAFAMIRDMEYVSTSIPGDLLNASYDIRHHTDGHDRPGPTDEHSKFNINRTPSEQQILISLYDMTIDVVAAIIDWLDEDDDPQPFGAERDYYLSLSNPYEPRNGFMRNTAEIELVAGIWPEYLRGEDWNLNGRLDANENDADLSWPDDEPDNVLDARWSAYLTASSTQNNMGLLGLPKIRLGEADLVELQERVGVDEVLAQELINFGRNQNSDMVQLLEAYAQSQDINSGSNNGTQNPTGGTTVPLLDEDQLRAVLAETSINNLALRLPGKININTVSEQLLEQIFFENPHFVDEIIFQRNSRKEGITSMVDLVDIPVFQEDPDTLSFVARSMDTTSSVYSITAVGRSASGGVETEITVVVDRSTLPIRILEYREQ